MAKVDKATLHILAVIIGMLIVLTLISSWDWDWDLDWGIAIWPLLAWFGFYVLWARRLIETAILGSLDKRGYSLSGGPLYFLRILLAFLWLGAFASIVRIIYLLF
jgi:hypothetical protein